MTTPSSASNPRTLLLYGGVFYLLFVIYGSLVPLDFHARSLADAWTAFSHLPYLDLGIESRADWGANILLFIPLAFLWLGIVWHPRSVAARIGASLLILLSAAALSASIEFAQLFFPPRTTSQNDIAAETLGACIGMLLWWSFGEKVVRFLGTWSATRANTGTAGRLLYLYLFFLFGYNLLPLDLTLSPVEIYHKWNEGKILLMPFGFASADPVEGLYGMVTDILIWIPVAFLLRLSSARTEATVFRLVVGASALLEFLQLFVYSRITNVTQVILAAAGALLGLMIARRFMKRGDALPGAATQIRGGWGRTLAWLACLAIWSLILCVVFWYPFDFHVDQQARTHLVAFFKVPFISYWSGSEYRAATEVLHKAGFFLPLGALLALALANIPAVSFLSEGARVTCALLFLAMPPLAIEMGQAFLPGKDSDVTDWALEFFGAAAGYLMTRRILAANAASARPVERIATHTVPTDTRSFPASTCVDLSWRQIAMTFITLMFALWFATQSAYAPYNVRKLLLTAYPILSLVLLTGFVCWVIGFPAWIALRSDSKLRWSFFPAVLCHGLVGYFLIRSAVPVAMIEKVAASPIMGWPWDWELMGRFTALFSVFSIAMTVTATAVAALFRLRSAGRFYQWLAGALLLLPLLHSIVITNAATDNLTELMANDASVLSSVLVLLFVMILCFAGSSLAAISSQVNRPKGSALWVAALLILSYPLAYVVISQATEQYILKYDKVFSALQFLLSSDRAHYAKPRELIVRYALFHSAVILMIAFVQRPFFSSQGAPLTTVKAVASRRRKRRGSRPVQAHVDAPAPTHRRATQADASAGNP